ncbi:MAG: D-alanyl-D-alanine carboxypeptidase/D-alanyl-D-alanine endopeptidase [Phycisphaerae bacterium]
MAPNDEADNKILVQTRFEVGQQQMSTGDSNSRRIKGRTVLSILHVETMRMPPRIASSLLASRRLASSLLASCLLACCFLLPVAQVSAQTATDNQPSIQVVLPGDRLERLLVTLPHESTVASACVVDVASKRVTFSYQRDLAVVPASTMKLFTMIGALETLGADFEFETKFYQDGPNVLVVGDGDPSTGNAEGTSASQKRDGHFASFVEALTKANVGAIQGDIVLDVARMEPPSYHKSWENSDHGRWYAAPVDAVNFNANCLNVTVEPGEPGKPAKVKMWPNCPDAEIDNRTKTGKGRNPIIHHPPGTRKYVVSGNCRKTWAFPAVSFPEPARLFGHALKEELRQAGISVAGDIKISRKPIAAEQAQLRDTLKTKLVEILPRIGKDSHGPYSEALLKRMGYAAGANRGVRSPGSWASGRKAMTDFLNKAGIDTKRFELSDGSGLSRDNRATAEQLCQLLAFAHKRPYAQTVIDSLAVAGVDGTLRRQMREQKGRVVAKTGTMTGIRTLSGYILSKSGERKLAFAIMFNDFPGSTTPYREIQDEFCGVLVNAIDW